MWLVVSQMERPKRAVSVQVFDCEKKCVKLFSKFLLLSSLKL